MTEPADARTSAFDDVYGRFDSPLMREMREEAYGQDIGQCSWTTAPELAEDIPRLKLGPTSHLLDLGCGPGGPLTYVAGRTGCRATGVDLSGPAVESARHRAAALGLSGMIETRVANLDDALPFPSNTFDAVMSIDVVIHLRDRAATFREVARVLRPSGAFLFTDASVVTGPISSEEVRLRSHHGVSLFVPPGFNESVLEQAGFVLVDRVDRTASALQAARGRMAARLARRAEMERVEGGAEFEAQLRYLATVVTLAERGAVARMRYVAELQTRDERR